jgi:excisionase family DNA binding protein
VGVDDVARHLQVGRDSVYRWVDMRRLPAHRVGRLLRFKLSEVDAWVRAGGGEEDHDDPAGGSGERSGKRRQRR